MTLDIDTRRDVVTHMNADHADAVLDYVKGIAGRRQMESARLIDIDETRMLIEGVSGEITECITITFDSPLTDASSVRRELIRLAKHARRQLANHQPID